MLLLATLEREAWAAHDAKPSAGWEQTHSTVLSYAAYDFCTTCQCGPAWTGRIGLGILQDYMDVLWEDQMDARSWKSIAACWAMGDTSLGGLDPWEVCHSRVHK